MINPFSGPPAPIDVGCAVILHQGRFLLSQRKPGDSHAGFWEFPGGTRHAGESLEDCLVREIIEETGILIRPRRYLTERRYPCGEKVLCLHFVYCDKIFGEAVAKDSYRVAWAGFEELTRYAFVPGDLDVVRELTLKKAHYFPAGSRV